MGKILTRIRASALIHSITPDSALPFSHRCIERHIWKLRQGKTEFGLHEQKSVYLHIKWRNKIWPQMVTSWGHILMPGVNRQPSTCPCVIRSFRMNVNTRSEHVFYLQGGRTRWPCHLHHLHLHHPDSAGCWQQGWHPGWSSVAL